jgi:hypothetical protein
LPGRKPPFTNTLHRLDAGHRDPSDESLRTDMGERVWFDDDLLFKVPAFEQVLSLLSA